MSRVRHSMRDRSQVRSVTSIDGPLAVDEPVGHCPRAVGIFSPLREALGLTRGK